MYKQHDLLANIELYYTGLPCCTRVVLRDGQDHASMLIVLLDAHGTARTPSYGKVVLTIASSHSRRRVLFIFPPFQIHLTTMHLLIVVPASPIFVSSLTGYGHVFEKSVTVNEQTDYRHS